MGVRLLLLSPLQQCSGNYATICRIRDEFEDNGMECVLACPTQFPDHTQLTSYIVDNQVDLVLGIHAYKSGRILKDIETPYVVILGGTDVNGYIKDKDVFVTMTTAIQNARHKLTLTSPVNMHPNYKRQLLAFSHEMCQLPKVPQYDPKVEKDRVTIIPQGVTVCPSNFCVKTYIRDQSINFDSATSSNTSQPVTCDIEEYRANSMDQIKLFSIVGGVRPVKNPLYVVQRFSEWRVKEKRLDCFLVIIGCPLDDAYFQQFYKDISRASGVVYISGLTKEECHSAIRDSFALVNTSESEGMALAILEAMCLGTSVLARGIAGNIAIVDDRHTGLVFNTPEEFIEKASQLLEEPDTALSLTQNASAYITQKHSAHAEETAYVNLVHNVLNGAKS